MTRSEADTTIAAVTKALAGNHPPEVERALVKDRDLSNRARGRHEGSLRSHRRERVVLLPGASRARLRV